MAEFLSAASSVAKEDEVLTITILLNRRGAENPAGSPLVTRTGTYGGAILFCPAAFHCYRAKTGVAPDISKRLRYE